MKIIISPAKKMNVDTDTFACQGLPVFIKKAERLKKYIQGLSYEEVKKLWGCNDKLAKLNYQRFQEMDLEKGLTPALISYEGIQYQYMAPEVFSEKEWAYVQEHLRILSGFYGVLKPLDGVTPYRLEMQAKAALDGDANLYAFWGECLYSEVMGEEHLVLNLASKEYSKAVEKYVTDQDRMITCVFGEWKDGKIVQKGTQAKMARGEMVRFLSERQIEDPEEVKGFDRLGYRFKEELSSDCEYIFIKETEEE